MKNVFLASPIQNPGTLFTADASNIYKQDNDFVLRILRNAADLSAGSEELDAHIHNRYSSWQLSSGRADLFRPLAGFLKGRSVLELGAGCGAITRYLGETCGHVVTIENDPQLAAITTERCRDLRNVQVKSSLVDLLPNQFDTVIFGDNLPTVLFPGSTHIEPAIVFEKASLQARNFLTGDGVIIVTINNPTALCQPTITAQILPIRPFCFSRKKALRLFANAGFGVQNWYYPFPDSISPAVILTDQAFYTPGFNAADIIAPHFTHASAAGIDPKLVQSLVENELMTEMSNSFLVVASSSPVASTPADALAYTYNTGRRRAFKKENLFLRQPEGILVQKELLHPQLNSKLPTNTRQHLVNEKYLFGKLYADKLTEVLLVAGWTIEDVFTWAHPYYCYLSRHADSSAAGKKLPGNWIDATPFNVVQQEGGRLEAIDLEWDAGEVLPLSYVFFRGLYHCLLRTNVMATPKTNTVMSAFELIAAVLKNFERNKENAAEQFMQLESIYFNAIVSGEPVAVTDFILPFPIQQLPGSVQPGMFPLTEVDLQVFVETDEQPFAEAHSATSRLQLSADKCMYVQDVAIPGGKLSRIRIDPSAHEGMIRLWAINVKEEQRTLFQWSPFVASPLQLVDAQLAFVNNTTEPILLLLSNDPMLIICIDTDETNLPLRQLKIEIEMAAVPASEAASLQEPLTKLCAAFLHIQLPAA